ncbi:MAG: plastocyanin/azurin family copper-binding protein [Actinomycetota bacterium]|nr:plastocyanin/azurin family copper-binding protein [Actinomycetota bacterium]
MRRRLVAVSLAVLALGAAPASGGPATQGVTIDFQSFTPTQLDVLPGDTVKWSNQSVRVHTVTADDGSFNSGIVFGGGSFSYTFDAVGTYPYHCTIHPMMMGEVDVRRVTLEPLPASPVPTFRRVTFTGRSADGSAVVNVEKAGSGGYRTVASVTPGPDGRWSATLVASTGGYRASSGADASETRRLLVVDGHEVVRVTGHTVAVTVSPPDPGSTVVLELLLRERFGWWPVKRARLDARSQAEFRVPGAALARVVVVDRDGWTPLLTSGVLRLRR